jgi:hypothetical protein
MKGSQHTPGPWTIIHSTDGHPVSIYASDEAHICDLGNNYDAFLIAAAPELYQSAQWCVEIAGFLAATGDCSLRERYAEIRDAANAALARAEGR